MFNQESINGVKRFFRPTKLIVGLSLALALIDTLLLIIMVGHWFNPPVFLVLASVGYILSGLPKILATEPSVGYIAWALYYFASVYTAYVALCVIRFLAKEDW